MAKISLFYEKRALEFRQEHERGVRIQTIALREKMAHETVKRWIERVGGTVNRKHGRLSEHVHEICRLFENGLSLKLLAQRYDVTYQTIRNRLAAAGFLARKRTPIDMVLACEFRKQWEAGVQLKVLSRQNGLGVFTVKRFITAAGGKFEKPVTKARIKKIAVKTFQSEWIEDPAGVLKRLNEKNIQILNLNEWPWDQLVLNEYWFQYWQLVNAALNRKELETKHAEKHHVLPVALGGPRNKKHGLMVRLTYAEHFRAHELLTKFTVGVAQSKMYFAFFAMANGQRKQRDRALTAEQFVRARNAVSARTRGYRQWGNLNKDPEKRAQAKARAKALWEDPTYRAKHAAMIYASLTPEQKARRDHRERMKNDPEYRARVKSEQKRVAKQRRQQNPEYRERKSVTMRAAWAARTPEQMAATRAKKVGYKHTPETIEKMRAGLQRKRELDPGWDRRRGLATSAGLAKWKERLNNGRSSLPPSPYF